MSLFKTGKNVSVVYYIMKDIPSPEVKKALEEKAKIYDGKTKIETKDKKWLITLPIMIVQNDSGSDVTLPIWNLMLSDQKKCILFEGFPQPTENECGVQYTLVADVSEDVLCRSHWTVSGTSSGQDYLKRCYESSIDFSRFNVFRIDSSFEKIIVSNSKESGQMILDRVSKNPLFLKHLKSFQKNDEIGSPRTHLFSNGMRFSCNTLQYVNTAYELINEFKDMKNWEIVEFGGGYGGLAHVLSYIVEWKSYHIIEITQVLALLYKCILNFDLNKKSIINLVDTDKCCDSETKILPKSYDLFIAEYSFCELNEEGLEKYWFLLERAKRAFLVMNLWNLEKKKKFREKLETLFEVKETKLFIESKWGDYIWILRKRK